MSIARAIELEDAVENAGAQLIKEVRPGGRWGGAGCTRPRHLMVYGQGLQAVAGAMLCG